MKYPTILLTCFYFCLSACDSGAGTATAEGMENPENIGQQVFTGFKKSDFDKIKPLIPDEAALLQSIDESNGKVSFTKEEIPRVERDYRKRLQTSFQEIQEEVNWSWKETKLIQVVKTQESTQNSLSFANLVAQFEATGKSYGITFNLFKLGERWYIGERFALIETD